MLSGCEGEIPATIAKRMSASRSSPSVQALVSGATLTAAMERDLADLLGLTIMTVRRVQNDLREEVKRHLRLWTKAIQFGVFLIICRRIWK